MGHRLRRHERGGRGAHLRAQTQPEQEIDARPVRVGRYDRALRRPCPRHRLRGAGDGHLAADADPAGRRGRGRESYPRRGNARRAYSRPRILPGAVAPFRPADRLDLGQHHGRADAQTVAGDRPRDRRRSGLRGQPPFRRAADRKAQFDHRLHRRRRCESHPPIAMPRTIRTEIQKRFSDIDSFRHVNNVSQQMYFDVGKSDFFDRLLGPEILFAPVRIITAATDTSYMGQIRFEDRIAVTTCVERIGTKSLTLLQRIVADDGTVRSQSRSVMVAFDFEAQQSVPVPDAWRRALEAE